MAREKEVDEGVFITGSYVWMHCVARRHPGLPSQIKLGQSSTSLQDEPWQTPPNAVGLPIQQR